MGIDLPPPTPPSGIVQNPQFHPVTDIRLRDGTILPMSEPLIMGILNVTPDSFSDGGRHDSVEATVDHGLGMICEGARIIDVGGESTRPYSNIIPIEEEIARVIPVIEALKEEIDSMGLDTIISIDTRKPEVAEQALQAGAGIINDVTALSWTGEKENSSEGRMAELAAEWEVPVVLMHMQGTPQTMQVDPRYGVEGGQKERRCGDGPWERPGGGDGPWERQGAGDGAGGGAGIVNGAGVVEEILDYLIERKRFAMDRGIAEDRIILDPGIGFGKTLEHNLTIMNRLDEFRSAGSPVLVGTSRKSIVGKVLDLPVEDRLEGTLATVAFSIVRGASIIRVHDVLQARRVMEMTRAMMVPGEFLTARKL
jgi:dihydropteroate synthase